jgi:hypothetical protein
MGGNIFVTGGLGYIGAARRDGERRGAAPRAARRQRGG